MTDFAPLTACLACGHNSLIKYFDGGSQPPANSFYKDGSLEPASYPLGLQYCPMCWHSQNLVAVDPVALYSNYAYASGTSQTLRDYFRDFVDKVEIEFGFKKLRVLDIACNDGSLLKEFQKRGHKVQGIDPASNLNDGSVPILNTFWNDAAIRMLPTNGGVTPYDVIIAMNVLGHVADPLTFLAAAKHVLAPGGRIYVQTSQARMVEEAQIDTCYHEHLSFFTAQSFGALAERAGLQITGIRHEPVHGVSYVITMIPAADGWKTVGDFSIKRDERDRSYYTPALYYAFSLRVALHVDHVKRTLTLLEREGYGIFLYGCAAKAITYANYAGLFFNFAVDDSPLKRGKRCPGIGNIVGSLDDVVESGIQRIAWVIGAWNVAPEIIAKIKKARPNADDKFVTYYPTVKIE